MIPKAFIAFRNHVYDLDKILMLSHYHIHLINKLYCRPDIYFKRHDFYGRQLEFIIDGCDNGAIITILEFIGLVFRF